MYILFLFFPSCVHWFCPCTLQSFLRHNDCHLFEVLASYWLPPIRSSRAIMTSTSNNCFSPLMTADSRNCWNGFKFRIFKIFVINISCTKSKVHSICRRYFFYYHTYVTLDIWAYKLEIGYLIKTWMKIRTKT